MPLSQAERELIILYEDMIENWNEWEEIQRICILRLYNKLGLPPG